MSNQHYSVVGVTFENRQEILSDFFKGYRHGGKYSVKLVHETDNQKWLPDPSCGGYADRCFSQLLALHGFLFW